ncbi:plant UBX domain-containing protein 9-like isoform X2 [Lotus japonicus]|uniref:plant UBX domain-containing protein 9-like isoform X2 n=1 Tax=Lotus japonicus TaxID=34305 RepID=UPI00258648FA|nr:plant UBX domain-containing protein 9-like isoform X2 [Lotus japonicus]
MKGHHTTTQVEKGGAHSHTNTPLSPHCTVLRALHLPTHMAPPTPDAIAAFMRITGASEYVAVQKLEEYGGNLNEAVNAHFIEGERHIQGQNVANDAAPNYNYSDDNNQNRAGSRGISPFLNAARRFRPSLLLDSNYRRELRDLYTGMGATGLTSRGSPNASYPGEVTGVPPGPNIAYGLPYQSGLNSANADVTGNLPSHGRGAYGTNDYQHDYTLAHSNSSGFSEKDAEEAMIQAAIEASKKESREGSSWTAPLNDGVLPQSHLQQDDDLAHAISLSLKTAEEEEAIRELLVVEEKDLLAKGDNSRSSLEWAGISSDELNEAMMLETALFGEIPNRSTQRYSTSPDLQPRPEKLDPKMQCSSSSASQLLTETQLLRQQQDADYQASLQADKQKELNSLKKAETHSSKEEESQKKMIEKKDLEKMLDKKEIMLPKEPPLGDEKVITIVVRMPNGNRCERRFLKTDKLQLLFDFIDIHGAVKPGSYRIVKSYPRCAYSINDSSSTLNEVGLSNKNEALFLELI